MGIARGRKCDETKGLLERHLAEEEKRIADIKTHHAFPEQFGARSNEHDGFQSLNWWRNGSR